MESKETIYIVGAGISGLIAAFELEKAGYAPIVLEKSNGVGGRVRPYLWAITTWISVFRYCSTATRWLKNTSTMMRLIFDAWPQGHRFMWTEDVCDWRSLTRFKMLIPTVTAKIGSVRDKIKVLRLNARMKRKSIDKIFASEEMTIEYLRKFGFSEVIIDRFFKPFFAGIFLNESCEHQAACLNLSQDVRWRLCHHPLGGNRRD